MILRKENFIEPHYIHAPVNEIPLKFVYLQSSKFDSTPFVDLEEKKVTKVHA